MRITLRRWITLAIAGISGIAAWGQQWFVPGRTYAKIKVAADSIYRITYNDLSGIFPNLSSVDPRHFQMYWRGRPYPILVKGEDDGSFDPTDTILFIGLRNDGVPDRPLYPTPSDQPNPRVSLFTDTNVYYLTIENTNGARINVVDGGVTAGRPNAASFRWARRVEFFQTYFDDISMQNEYLGSSYYGPGEGWMSTKVTNNKELGTPMILRNRLYPDPQVQLRAYAVSQTSDLVCGRLLNNNFQIKIKTQYQVAPGVFRDTTYIPLDTFFGGYRVIAVNKPIPSYYINDSVDLIFFVRPKEQSGGCYSASSVAYMELSYLHTLSLSDIVRFPFQFQTEQASAPSVNHTFQQVSASVQHPWIYDTASHTLYRGVWNGSSFQVSLPPGRNLFFFDSADIASPLSITPYVFSNLLAVPPQTDYLIISNTRLKNGAEAYKAYRQSTGFRPHIVYADSLYDAFYYGLHHPLALRRFFEQLHAADSTIPLQYVLFLGKGIQTSTLKRGRNATKDLVPTWGIPPSDYLFLNTIKDADFFPDYYVGRISALDNHDIYAYLAKVQAYEQLSPARWRKNILHLAGGRDINENALYANFLNRYAGIAEDTPAGMFIRLIRKADDLPVTTTLKAQIIESINNGMSLMTYFGHGAADILEVDIGEPEEYANYGKYPIMYFAGCILGNCYSSHGSMGERFLMHDSAGALVWIAGTGYGIQDELHGFNLAFYSSAFYNNYGRSIGKVLRDAMGLYYRPGFGIRQQMQCLQFNLQGDPAIQTYSVSQPDYEITAADIAYEPSPLHTGLDSFTLLVTVRNWGRAIRDSVTLQILHSYPGNQQTDTFTYKVIPPFNQFTYALRLPMGGIRAHGRNVFAVSIDPDNLIAELDEDNNSATVTAFIVSNTAVPLFPVNDMLVGSQTVTLKAQGTGNRTETFEFEIDTIPSFSSPWKQVSPPITSSYLATWDVTLLPDDSLDYYWRVRLRSSDSAARTWVSASFTYVAHTYPGWGQVDYPQYSKSAYDGVYYDSTHQLRFYRYVSPIIKVQSTGDLYPDPAAAEIRYDYARMIFGFLNNHLYMVAFNPDNLELFSYPSSFASNTRIPWAQHTFFHFHFGSDISVSSARDSFAHIMRQIPDGYHVILFAGRAANNFPQWSQDTVFTNAMQLIGAGMYQQISGTGWPYICIGRKGNYGPAVELTADTSANALNPREQKISASTTFYPIREWARMFSQPVGPAYRWKDFYTGWQHTGADSVQFRLWGITPSGEERALTNYFQATSRDLDTFDARQYPYIKIEAYLEDRQDRTPPQLRYWIIHYEGAADLSVRPDAFFQFHADTLIRGDTLRMVMQYENIAADSFPDSVMVVITIRSSANAVLFTDTLRRRPLPPSHADTLFFQHPTAAFKEGTYWLSIELNPGNNPGEIYLFNNFYLRPFFVKGDHLNPVIDVTFDGKHIFNGEEVSPAPEVRITGRDDHPFFFIDDTALISVAVRYPNDSVARRLHFTDPAVEFIPSESSSQPAVVYWRPPHLNDGVYTLEVMVRDPAGNTADSPSYAIDFEVVNATTISYVLPYPNPFTTSTRFVYSLTGSRLPDRISIYIMSITGEVVKEIHLHEYDAFQVGQNISSYVWDGTTEDGTPLANGVYLYKVVAYIDGEPVKIRSKGLGDFFKHGVGKMVILR